MFWFIIDKLDELFMPNPENDDRMRWAKRAGLIVVIAAASAVIFD